MDALRPGHAHRSSSDRLLSNYLESQKHLNTSLLTLLSHSHTSSSSLLAYVTSSPGVLVSVRRAVKHAAFEGPLSQSMLENPAGAHDMDADPGTPGWASYVSSLEDFRKDLKQIHLLEEEMTRVKRDKEILVTRLIKQTKTRPTKSDIKDMASTLTRDYDVMSSQGSTYSFSSDHSASGGNKESRRASKLKEAQAEYLGCEEHLRGLEVRIESERNKVMYRGLEERFRAMEVVGHMWLTQARRGLEDLEKLPELPPNAYELESNGSLAPSQSASQVGYDEAGIHSPKRPINRQIISLHGPGGPGSIDGSIAEEDENGGSSDDEPAGQFVVHENKQRQSVPNGQGHSTAPIKPSPLATSYNRFSDTGRAAPARKANSELGAPSAYGPQSRASLRRTVSDDRNGSPRRAGSDTSSVRTVKRKGFFASIARFFKGPKPHGKKRDNDRDSTHGAVTTYGKDSRGSGARAGWSTRTDDNLKRASTFQAGRRTRSDSSSDDEPPNLVSVANDRSTPGWNVADVGRVSSQKRPPGMKRSASTKSRGTAVSSASTITGRKPAAAVSDIKGPAAAGIIPHSSTFKSSKSAKSDVTTKTAGTTRTAATAKSTGTVKSTGTRTRPNGSISRTKSMQSTNAPNIMSIVGAKPPAMPEVPKAPTGDPGMHMVRAPGSSLVPGDYVMPTSQTMNSLVLPSQHMSSTPARRAKDDEELRPSDSISRSNSTRTARSAKEAKEKRKSADARRAVSPLPPSKLRSPPLKSAMRPTSPTPRSSQHAEPMAPITTLYSITAPGPVQLPPDEEPKPAPPIGLKGPGVDVGSVYESAGEEPPAPRNYESDSDAETLDNYNVVENERIARIEGREMPHQEQPDTAAEAHAQLGSVVHAPAPVTGENEGTKTVRRKSVRMNVPEGERDAEYYRQQAEKEAHENHLMKVREQEKEAAEKYQAAAAARDDSPPPSRAEGNWSTRIGHMREDTSDEEDLDPSYMRARKNLIAASSDVDDKKKKRKSGTGSTRSKGSKASTSRSSRR